MVEARRRAGQVDTLTGRLDSLTVVLSTQSSVMDENRTLRAMLGIAERGGPRFVPASVVRPSTAGSESLFILDVGTADGVAVGAAVVGPYGLVGQVREVRSRSSVGMDWSHPDFRVSAMLVDGTTYGILETRRGRFREDDRLILNGTAYDINVRPGTEIVTSGLGGVFPRGIPVGKIDRLLDTQGSWRKSLWVEPMVEPASVTHVLVLTGGGADDVSAVWPADSLITREEAIGRAPGS
jgi:rod shape-determining protein MreC